MRHSILRGTLILAATLAARTASATNICQAEKLTCATTMPVGGFCECTAHGVTKDGTVIPKPAHHAPINSSGAGCGAQPGSPGCK